MLAHTQCAIRDGEVVGTAGADGGELPHVSSQYVLHGRKRQNSFGKAHVLPCIPSLIQLQEPYTGRIMSRRRATSGMWDTYSISPVRLSTSGTKPGDGLGLGEGDSHRQTP